MTLRRQDIYIQSKGNTPWIREAAIIQFCRIKEDYFSKTVRPRYNTSLKQSELLSYKKGIRKLHVNSGASWRYGRINNQFFYCYDNLPLKHQEKLGDRDDIIALATGTHNPTPKYFNDLFIAHLEDHVGNFMNNADVGYYMYECGHNLPSSTSMDLARARAWMEMISHYEDEQTYKTHQIQFERDFFDIAVQAMPSVAFNNLSTGGSLRKKVHYYRQSDNKRQFMLSGKLGNTNSLVMGVNKITSMETGEVFRFDAHEAIIYNLWMNPGRPGKKLKVDVYEEYLNELSMLNEQLSPVSERTVNRYLNRFSNRARMSLERDGKDHFNDTYKPYIVQHKLKYALSMWAADFSGAKIYHREQKEKWVNGKRRKTNQWIKKSWYVFRIFDVATGCIVGWSACDSGEKWEQVGQGLEQAVNACGGRAACEIVTDHGSVFTQKENAEKLALLFRKHHLIRLHNKQANPAEMYIRLSSRKARQFDNWFRSSFDAQHPDNRANEDYMNIMNLPTKGEALEQVAQLIEQWNNTPNKEGIIPADFTSNLDNHNPQAPVVDPMKARYVFGNSTRTQLARSRGVLAVSKGNGQYRNDYYFQIPNWATSMEHIDLALGGDPDMQVDVRWDDTGADIYTPHGQFIMTAEPYKKSHKSQYESTPETEKNFNDQIANKERFERIAREHSEEVQEARNVVIDELTYNQRAALNGGRAKDEHNEIMKAVYEVNKDLKPFNEDEQEYTGNVLDDI